MRTVGHRGASALAPENTLLAVEVAISHGLDFAEIDVHLSRDGHIVVHHDAEVTLGDGTVVPIASLSAADLARVPKGDGQFVPTLEQMLDLAGDRIGLYVECKAPGTPAALGALLGRRATAPDLIAGSFSPDLVADLRRAVPDLPRSVLFGRVAVPSMIDTCRAVDARYAHPCARPITGTLIERLHAAGLEVMTPHTNDADEAEQFWRAGSDVIASDDPRLLVALERKVRDATSALAADS